MAERRIARLWYRGWPMAALCVSASTVWLITDAWPQAGSTLGSGMAGCLIAAVVCIGVAWRRGWGGVSELAEPALGGALVLGGPAVGMLLGAAFLDAGSLAIALALTPVLVVVVESVGGAEELTGEGLWPGLAACCGLLLMLPAPSLTDWRNDVALLLAPVLTGTGCVLFRRSGLGAAEAWKASAGLAGGGAVFGLGVLAESLSRRGWPVISPAATGVDAVLSLLAVVALGRLTAAQYSARYVLVPLAVLLQGVVLLHSVPTWRGVACGILLAVAGVVLLRPGEERRDSGDGIR